MREECEFEQTDGHAWYCTTHDVSMIGPEPVHCTVGYNSGPWYETTGFCPSCAKNGAPALLAENERLRALLGNVVTYWTAPSDFEKVNLIADIRAALAATKG